MFRSPNNLEKMEMTKVNLETPIRLPGNNQAQEKTGYRFFVRDRDVVYDWFNAYFRDEFQLQASADGASVAADTPSTPINSSFSSIKNLNVRSGGKTLYEANNVHKVIFIKNLVEYSDDYSRTVAKDEFWYLDTDNTTMTTDAATNTSIHERTLRSQTDANGHRQTVKTVIPLNRYSFFEELSDRLLTAMQLEFEVTLQDDTEIIFQNNATASGIVVTKLELWIPRLQMTAARQALVIDKFFKASKWKYLKETLIATGAPRDAGGQVHISPGVKNAKHVFVFFQQTRKDRDRTPSTPLILTATTPRS